MKPKNNPIPKITLEQWAAFKAVVDEGTYARAAEVLNKSQSSISYAIARLNDMLPSPALELDGRKTVLTPVGTALYRYAKGLIDQALATEQAAQCMASGWESNVTLVTDAVTPMHTILCALQDFSQLNPFTRVKVLETSLSGTDEALLGHECDLAITPRVPPGFLGDPLVQICMIAVAHKTHPLANQETISESELKAYRQIVVRDSGLRREQDVGWLGAEQRWTVSHFATSVDAIRAGLGFAFLPTHRIAKDLEQGDLIRLPLEMGAQRNVPLSLVMTAPAHAGPATRALAQVLKDQFRNAAQEVQEVRTTK